MKINRKILQVLLLVNIFCVLSIITFFNIEYIYAFEIGFLSSSLVITASLLAYKRMVNTRVEHNIITYDDSKDVIDILEDPYDLYSENEKKPESELDLVAVVKEEHKKVKSDSRSLFEILRDTKAALSVYRLGAYIVLILGFLYLNRHGLLHIPSYIVALGLPPFIIVWLLAQDKAMQTEDKVQ
ncbi:hypothetical protein MNB_SV-13-1221 [hydrothermal vent metagenome]|uniref:Uncharacterized protein n=1 Tax=hydrothermal vent metagenome TaxID=652676 RepID=A0A1W1CQN0_9ZZZZ